MTIKEIHKKLVKKEISAIELTKDYLKRIEEKDKNINSFLTIIFEAALSQAKEAQKIIDRKREKTPLLCGVPCAIKDNILVENFRCTAGSKILENYIAPYDATVIKKLKKEGAVILGKTNMDEFAMGSSTENSAFGRTSNPYDLTRVPGGSSGGSAAAVVANLCQFALGSDTGGSIRQPASFCGVAGFKPTYGVVSRYGLMAMASSLDQIGSLAKSAEDAKIVYEAIKGRDHLDSTSVDFKDQGRIKEVSHFKNFKIGIPKEYFIKGLDDNVKNCVQKMIEKIKKLGAEIKEVSLPHTKYALAVYYLIMPSEVSSNLARFDGIKYGIKTEDLPSEVNDIIDFYAKVRGEKFGREAKRRIILGTFSLSAGYYDQYYTKAQKVRRLIKEDFDKIFSDVDLILTPTTPTVSFKAGEKMDDPLKMYLTDVFTVGISLAGLPAISIPCGFSEISDNNKKIKLPVGIQIIGNSFNDTIFDLAKEIERLVE